MTIATITASSIHEAVKLATQFREKGRYDFFRGQRHDWPLRSTLARLKQKADLEHARDVIQLFFSWIASSPELKELADRQDSRIVDQKYAIAQHYGLPTNFCDFTTEPSIAGFFASSDVTAKTSGTSVIICCNSGELLEWCKERFSPESLQPEVLRLSVPNLWRIEAQRGVFLFLPYADFEEAYPLDRIEFPAGPYDGVAFEDVYPRRRSQLEILLDQYFRFEVEQQRHGALMARASEFWFVRMPDAAAMMRESLVDDDPGPHASWTEARQRWSAHIHEPWVPGEKTVRVETGADFKLGSSALRKVVLTKIRSALAANPLVRSQASTLVSNDAEFPNVINLFQALWDGLRTLPYSDDDLAMAMGNVAFLAASLIDAFRTGTESLSWQHVAALLLKKPQMVEFGRTHNAAAPGYVDEDSLLDALRPDFVTLVKPEHATIAARGGTVIQVVQMPSRAFVFEKFASIFATQVVPTQVMLFRSKAHVFNAFHVEFFGLP